MPPTSRVACALLALTPLSACVVAQDQRYVINQDVSAVVMDLGKGDVTVEVGPPGEVVVDIDMGGLTTNDLGPRLEGDVLYLEYRCGGVSICGGDLWVQVPPDMLVDVELGAGDLSVWELHGDVRAQLGSGDLTAELLHSEVVWLATGAGAVDAHFEEPPFDLHASVGAGDVWLTVPPGAYDLDVDAGAGVVITDGIATDASSDRHITAQAGAGAVTVEGLPPLGG